MKFGSERQVGGSSSRQKLSILNTGVPEVGKKLGTAQEITKFSETPTKKCQFPMQFCIIRVIVATKPRYLEVKGSRRAHQFTKNYVNSDYWCAWEGREDERQPRS